MPIADDGAHIQAHESGHMHAVAPPSHGTIRSSSPSGPSSADSVAISMVAARPMSSFTPKKFVIQGLTKEGRTFRPSDWAERLAGAMSCFRPAGTKASIGEFISYSPYCVPHVHEGVKCVIVSEALRGVEPMAWDFVMNFARDNDLQMEPWKPPTAA